MSNIKNYWADVAIQFKDNKTAEKFIDNYEKRRQSLIKNPIDNNYGSFFQNDMDSDYLPDYHTSCDDKGYFYVLRENINCSPDLARTKALTAELDTNNYDAVMTVVDADNPSSYAIQTYEYGDGLKNKVKVITTRHIMIPGDQVIINPHLE